MARTQAPATAREHLNQLAAVLQQREWRAQLADHSASLLVTNPDASIMSERVTCDGSYFLWSWREKIGSVEDVETVATRIMQVLRGIAR